ncbi:MAG: GCN5-related N-acetyltransferase [Symbiobacteriaceae bacterium]|jgi:ribosomal protein S18 acetylase RimI-like enzyme|nr:GCN5-related N-acetyltransferase [Symbiobacteriaceae bacterium]
MATTQMQIGLRTVTPADDSLVFAAYASTRAAEMSLVPWSDEQRSAFLRMQLTAQLTHYQTYHPQAEHQIILADGRPAGRLYLDRQSDALHILDLTILPAFRNLGLGTRILTDLQAEAAPQKKAVRIHVEMNSPAFRLYHRLGFGTIADKGLYILLEWRPDPSAERGQP